MKNKASNEELLNYLECKIFYNLETEKWNLVIQRYIKFDSQTLHNYLGGHMRKPHTTTIMFDK